MSDDTADRVLKSMAHETWDDTVRDASLPLFARLRALEHSLRTLGFEDAERLVKEARASMAFAASRAEQVAAIAKSAIGSDPAHVLFLGGMALGDCTDIRAALIDGIHNLADGGVTR
jgi:hypothetical protein